MKTDRIRKFLRKRLSAFTLVELIVVITILAILATIGFLALSGYSQDAKDSAIKANVRSVQTAISSESAVSGNSPRYYVVHDSWAALSGAFAYVDGTQTALTGGAWNQTGTNYSAGNPDYAKLKLNAEKFKVGYRGFESASAAFDSKYLVMGAFDATVGNGNKTRSVSYFQVAGIAPATWVAVVSGNYPASSGSVAGLVRDPKTSGFTGALVDGANSSLPASPVNGVCGTASKNYAFPASSFGSDTFCPSGSVSTPASPVFPSAWSSTSWTCPGQNGGSPASCTANRAAWANCGASTQTVNARTYSLAAFNNGATLVGTSAAAVTGWTQTYSQTFACTDGAVTTSGAETWPNVTCSADFGFNSNACVPKSCRIQKEQVNTSSASGNYSIDPDGTGGNAPFTAYCDMTTDGGGWTLVFYSNSDNVSRSVVASWDWNTGPAVNFSRLYSMKNSKNASGLYEFFVKDSSTVGRYMTFTQTNAYDGNPVGNSFTKKTGNMYYSSQVSGTTWYGLALGSYGNSAFVSSCTLAMASEWGSWTYCLQDQLAGSYGTGPWFYDAGYDSWSQAWVQVYQK